MERRVFLAILLSFVVFYGYQTLFLPPPPAPGTTPGAAPGAGTNPAATDPAAPAAPAAETATPPAPENQPAAITGDTTEREVTVDTATVQAVFSNRGGRLLHWRLKDYRGDGGEPVDLVPSVPENQPRPFSLRVDDAEITRRLNTSLYRVSGDNGGRVDATGREAVLTFEYQDAAGLHVRKEFRFQPSGYVVTFSTTVALGDQALNPAILWGPGLSDIGASTGGGSFFTGNYVQPPQAIVHRGGKVERITADTFATEPAHEGDFRFAGIDDHYFLAAALDPGQARLEYRPVTLPGADADTQRQLLAESIRPRAPAQSIRFFIGPKQVDALRAADAELVRTINFGIFDFVVVPLLTTLKWLYGYIGNYGLSIIVLTILINLAMFPLRHKSVVAMRKMQEIQPQMKAIQDRYSHLKVTDPGRQKMQTEIMSLYRERGVNPASGCVPMLMTMPVLLAFYSLLSMSVELRGARFGGWIQDLSAPDPFYVIPALMGVTMFWQQRITPTTADPAQQKIMMFMPIMFTGMMLFSPSGVVLYWFVSNLWAIGQQYFTNWLIGPPVILARPPAERRVKSAGRGKTPAADKS